ncbi:MAG: hypothetical protein U0736_08240 [Gemmataceae bacterium]
MTTLTRLVVTTTLVSALAAPAVAATVAADWQEAVAAAKRDNRDLVVLLTGSDWDRISPAVAAARRASGVPPRLRRCRRRRHRPP